MIQYATRSPLDAEVVIVGAGPAGSALAILLAQRDISTVVLDRSTFPRPKPCGECINPGAVAALERLGVLDAVLQRQPSRISGWALATEGGATARGCFDPSAPHGLAMPRSVLDAELVTQVRGHGVRVLEHTKVTGVSLPRPGTNDPVSVEAVTGGKGGEPTRAVWNARLVVGADGLRSVVARRLGLVRRRPRIRKISLTCRLHGTGPARDVGTQYFTRWGTIGLAPVHAREPLWNGTVVVYADRVGRGRAVSANPTRWFRDAFRQAPFRWDDGQPQIVGGPWTSGPFDCPTTGAVADGAVLIGDAAGYFDPLTGQGMFRAFRSAELAAPVIARAVRSGRAAAAATDLRDYERALHRAVRPTRRLQQAIEIMMSRPATREFGIGRLASAGSFTDRLVQTIGDAVPVGVLARPSAWLPLLWSRR